MYSCSVNEKLDPIPEGDLKPKPQTVSTQNRSAAKVISPPATSTSSPATRSSTTSKRVSNGEISSTTAAAIAAVSRMIFLDLDEKGIYLEF